MLVHFGDVIEVRRLGDGRLLDLPLVQPERRSTPFAVEHVEQIGIARITREFDEVLVELVRGVAVVEFQRENGARLQRLQRHVPRFGQAHVRRAVDDRVPQGETRAELGDDQTDGARSENEARAMIEWSSSARVPLRVHAGVEQPDRYAGVELLPVFQVGHGVEVGRVERGGAVRDVDERAHAFVERGDLQNVAVAQPNRRREGDGVQAANGVERSARK